VPKVLICCSGGIDSFALIYYYLEQKFDIKAIHFDYGHPAFKEEKKALKAISQYYKIQIIHEDLKPTISAAGKNGEFVGRNALLVLSAISFLDKESRLISLGIHSGTFYYDCSPVFTHHMQNILDGYFGGTVILDTPFLGFSKSDIISWSRNKQLPLELTYSCQRGSTIPCGECLSCAERKQHGL
jgi:7-cyano-7-deazaguanine synthase